MKQLSEKEALNRAAAYCSGTERCIQDVEKKLSAAGLPPEATERIISRLLREKFIDESRFANSFINDKLRFNKWGRIRIDYELKKRGIPDNIRAEAMENIDRDLYVETLYNLLKSKKKSVKAKDRREEYYKLLRFAAGRGFQSHEINVCLKDLLNGADYEDME